MTTFASKITTVLVTQSTAFKDAGITIRAKTKIATSSACLNHALLVTTEDPKPAPPTCVFQKYPSCPLVPPHLRHIQEIIQNMTKIGFWN